MGHLSSSITSTDATLITCSFAGLDFFLKSVWNQLDKHIAAAAGNVLLQLVIDCGLGTDAMFVLVAAMLKRQVAKSALL